jgi:hypothetical protein
MKDSPEKISPLRRRMIEDMRMRDETCDAAFLGGPVARAYARFDAPTRASMRRPALPRARSICSQWSLTGVVRLTRSRASSSQATVSDRLRSEYPDDPQK